MLRNLLTCLLVLMLGTVYGQGMSVPTEELSATETTPLITQFRSLLIDKGSVQLRWQCLFAAVVDYFTIERSSNGRDFEVVMVLKQSESSPLREWTDEAPAKGRNQYRIRCSLVNGGSWVSNPVDAQVAGDISFTFYPNPVDNILIIRSDSPVEVQIMDASGRMRFQQSRVQGLQLINVAMLEKGMYVLNVFNRQANILEQEKLLKK